MFDPNKLYQVRGSGQRARFLGTLVQGLTVWAVQNSGMVTEHNGLRQSDGKAFNSARDMDIIEVQPTAEERKIINAVTSIYRPGIHDIEEGYSLTTEDEKLLAIIREIRNA